jgi:PmbA protein
MSDLRQLAVDVLERATRRGATEADVVIAEGETCSVQVRVALVDRLTRAKEKRLGLRVFFGKRSSSAATSDFAADSLERFVADTCDLAAAVVEDDVSGLPPAGQLATDRPDLDLYDATTLTTEQHIEWACRAETAAFEHDRRISNSEGAEFNSSSGVVMLGNTHGFFGDYRSSSFSLSVSPVAADSRGGMQRDTWYAVRRHVARLDSPEAVGQEAARRAVRRLGARKIATKRVPVIFDQETAGSLLANLCSAVSGYAIYKGTSFLIGQLGRPIAPPFITVIDDGRMPGGLGSRPFDGEGAPTRATTVIDRGVLASYLLDAYSGRKVGGASTGNASRSVGESPSVGPTNFYLAPGTVSPDAMIRSVREGLYVTELIGFGVNMVTGDYSRGAAGFWIEKGELAYPVEEITIAGNLKRMFADLQPVGNDLEFRGRIASPTVMVGEMMVAGN